MLIETLAGLLSGAGVTHGVGNWLWDDGTPPTNHGAAFIAVDTDAIMPAGKFTRRVEAMVDEIHNAPRVEGVDRIYVPGEMEWERYDLAMKEGIQLPPDVVTSLQDAASMTGLDLADLAR